MGPNGRDAGKPKGGGCFIREEHPTHKKLSTPFSESASSGPAYLAHRDVSQRLERHKMLENQGGDGHLQPDSRAVIDGPGKGPEEDFGELGGKKGDAQANAHPDVPGGALDLPEDLVNEDRLENSAAGRGEAAGVGGRAGRPPKMSASRLYEANFLINFGGCRCAQQGLAL